MRLSATFGPGDLSPSDERELDELIRQAHFFELPPRLAPSSPVPDAFTYDVTIESGDRRHTVSVAESAVPPDLRALLKWLIAAARTKRGRPPG